MSLDFKAFKFWCQTVLPTVYDDSLSYYELLSKVVSKLNGVIEETSTAFNELEEQFNNLLEDVNKFTSELEFEKYVDSYFNELIGDRDIEKLIADFLSSNYNTNFLELADVEIFAQHFAEDKVIRSSQGMDIGVINGVPYMCCCLAGSEAENLIAYPYYQSNRENNGVHFIDNGDGTISTDGIATEYATFLINSPDNLITLPIGSYTLSGCPSDGGGAKYKIQVLKVDGESKEQLAFDTGIGETFTITQPTQVYFRIMIYPGYDVSGLEWKPMLEVGDVVHSYVEYGNYIQPQFTIYNMNTGERVYTAHDNLLGHMNDVCFCSKDNSWYLTVDSASRYYTRFNLETGVLEHILCPIEEFNYLHGIAYNEKENVFYVYAKSDSGNLLCKVNYELNKVLNKKNYVKPNYNGWADQGIYFDGVYLYKLNSRITRDSKYSVFNHLEIYTSDMVYIKTINTPYSSELEAMSFYNGKYYFSYNCYSRCGLIFKGDIFSTNNSYHTRDAWLTPIGIERFGTKYTAYIGNYDIAGFFCDNTKERPFCHVWCGCTYLTDVNKTYATFELVGDVECDFVCYGQTFTNLYIYGNGFKWKGYMRIENILHFHCENLTVIANNSWCIYIDAVPRVSLNGVNCDTTGGDTAINCYDSNITLSGEYYNTATNVFINSNRLVNIRFNTMPTSGATTFGCSTYAMTVHDIKAHAMCGHSLYDTMLNSGDDVKDIWRNGTFIVQSDNVPIGAYANRNAVIIATNIGGSSTKLEWVDRSRLNTQKDIAVAYRIVDHKTGFDSGWIDIKCGYNLLSEKNVTFYIDSENGSDDNDGSREKPFATFNRFALEYTSYSELRCTFIGNGAYYECTNIETFNACSIHIVNESNNPNVILSIKGKAKPAFYNSHLNIDGTVDKRVTLDIPNNLYFDGGHYTMKYTDITNGGLSMNGGYATHVKCVFTNCRLRVSGGTLTVTDNVFNGDITACIAGVQGAVIKVTGKLECNANITGDYGVIYGENCTIFIAGTLTLSGTQKGLYLKGCIVNSSNKNYNSWNVNGSKYLNTTLLSDTYQFLNN